jgi:hypothetical protein
VIKRGKIETCRTSEKSNGYTAVLAKLKGNNHLGDLRVKREDEDNIKLDLKDIECDIVISAYLAQDTNHLRVVLNILLNLTTP